MSIIFIRTVGCRLTSRSAEDATAAMAFDGIIFINGPLKIRRPKDYGGIEIASPGVHVPGVVSTNVLDSFNKVFVGGNGENDMELLKSFGELRAFNLVRENGTGASKVLNHSSLNSAEASRFSSTSIPASPTWPSIQSLNAMELGDRYLVVQRASVGAKSGTPSLLPNPNRLYDQFEIPRPPDDGRAYPAHAEHGHDGRPGRRRGLHVKDECANYGMVEDLHIPRPVKKDKAKWGDAEITVQNVARLDEAAGVWRVCVKYTSRGSVPQALNALAGRSFAGCPIITTLLSEDSQTTPPLNLIFAPQPDAPPLLPTS